MRYAALGFRVKSGWATAILLERSKHSPKVCESRLIELAPSEMRQPYHASVGTLETNSAKLKRRLASVRRVTQKSVVDLLKTCRQNGYKIHGAGIVVGSLIDPESIANLHIRAHALEGRLFRSMLQDALRSRRIRCAIFSERDIHSTASKLLRRSPARIQRTLVDLGRLASGPWRADQKLATLAAWMSLS